MTAGQPPLAQKISAFRIWISTCLKPFKNPIQQNQRRTKEIKNAEINQNQIDDFKPAPAWQACTAVHRHPHSLHTLPEPPWSARTGSSTNTPWYGVCK
jgi:hypothetical protein